MHEACLHGLLELVKNSLINRLPALEVLDDYSLEQRRRDVRIPDAFRIDDDDRSIAAHAQTWSLTALHAPRAEEQILSLQELGEQ